MSRLDELIAEYCPDGVEYVRLPEIFNTRNGYTPSKSNPEYWENGSVPWFRMEDIRDKGRILSSSSQLVSRSAVKGDPFPANSIIVATSATIGEHALITVPSLANQRFTYLMLKDKYRNTFDIKFLFYYCFKLDTFCKEHLNQGNFASVDMKQFARFEFPVPPLPVQREIVRILDNFTELTARKKQYQYYLDLFYGNPLVESVPLQSLGSLTRGKRFVHADSVDEGIPCIHYGELYTYYGSHADKAKSRIREELKSKLRYASTGDVVIVGAGENKTDIGVGVAWEGNYDVAIHDACYTLKHSQNPRYISYFLRTTSYHKQILKYVSEGKICSISADGVGKAMIPLPSLAEQERIVSILDHFETLCNDLTSGLPAEIEARQKQYEYYRDKLLAFRPLT